MSEPSDNGPEPTGWRIVPVAELPFPHDLFRCDHKAVHRRAIAGEADTPDGRRRAFEQFVLEVGPQRLAACDKHRHDDWRLEPEKACERVRAALAADAEIAPDEDVDKDLNSEAFWFFSHPIWIDGNRLGGGQHRSCAMRAAGAVECPIEVYLTTRTDRGAKP